MLAARRDAVEGHSPITVPMTSRPLTGRQPDLFDSLPSLRSGFAYRAGLVSPQEEQDLLAHVAGLPFRMPLAVVRKLLSLVRWMGCR
jgi:hypothetical protein